MIRSLTGVESATEGSSSTLRDTQCTDTAASSTVTNTHHTTQGTTPTPVTTVSDAAVGTGGATLSHAEDVLGMVLEASSRAPTRIAAVVPLSAAAAAGARPGDLILAVNDCRVAHLPASAVRPLLLGTAVSSGEANETRKKLATVPETAATVNTPTSPTSSASSGTSPRASQRSSRSLSLLLLADAPSRAFVPLRPPSPHAVAAADSMGWRPVPPDDDAVAAALQDAVEEALDGALDELSVVTDSGAVTSAAADDDVLDEALDEAMRSVTEGEDEANEQVEQGDHEEREHEEMAATENEPASLPPSTTPVSLSSGWRAFVEECNLEAGAPVLPLEPGVPLDLMLCPTYTIALTDERLVSRLRVWLQLRL